MRKIAVFVSLVLMVSASISWGMDRSIIDRNDLSLKAGPTDPGEGVSMVWLESYVYPKVVKEDRVVSLGVRGTSKIESVTAYFDFSQDKVALTSYDGLYWSGAFKIPDNVVPGLHVARYSVKGRSGRIRRTVEFFIEESADFSKKGKPFSQGEAVVSQSWPLTVTATSAALVGGSSRILFAGQKVVGIYKVPWYKVVFEDGEEGFVAAAVVKEPLEDYYKQGYEAYRNKDFSSAIEAYKTTIAIKPDFVKGHLWLAKSYYHSGDMTSAYRSIMEALRLDERDMNCRVFANKLASKYYDTARAKFNAGRYNEAVASYQKVLELKPNSALSWIELGQCYAKLDVPMGARAAWREALKIEPENKQLHALLNISVAPMSLARRSNKGQRKLQRAALTKTASEMPPVLMDDSLVVLKAGKTKKGTRIDAALKSVIALTKSLGTPVVEKGWKTVKKGDKFLVRYFCEQGAGAVEAFDWLVDIDTKRISANNANARLLMNRW